jgi:hypothetical protein
MNNPQKLAALAALVGITPETHRQFIWDTSSGTAVNVSGFPALDTPAGDDVFLAPLMRWLKLRGYWPKIFFDGEHWNGVIGTEKRNAGHMETMTAALLRACQSAGVPEIVAIFGEGEV